MRELTCPFRVGSKYRVRRDYSFLNHRFVAGELVEFSSFAYDAKGGVTRYWFKSPGTDETNVWHIFDNQEPEPEWNDLFEEICSA